MTLKDLQNDVYALGYERPLEESELFISSLNRALRIIYAEQKYKKTVKIHPRSPKIRSYFPLIKCNSDTVTLPLAGRAYSMRVCGKGSYKIAYGAFEDTQSFDGEDILIRGFIDGEGVLTLFGKYSFRVYELTVYDEIFSDLISDIPDGSGKIKIDFSRYADFLSFAEPPRDSLGALVSDVHFEGSLLVCDKELFDVSVTYNIAPRTLSFDSAERELDIPRDIEASLSLLCASFLWRDDEPELSEHYFSLYRELTEAAKAPVSSRSEGYKTVDGWA